FSSNLLSETFADNVEECKHSALDLINQMEFKEYDSKVTNKHVNIACMLEKLKEVDESFVDYHEESKSETVNETLMLATAIKAIQEQQEIIESQNKKMEELEKQVLFLMKGEKNER
ncbi:MAG: hypothetical protein FWC68_04900, partial [Oscillospiraceae bacterium]|nr:hypothetical protein [Oscillospiraceae bacterium]